MDMYFLSPIFPQGNFDAIYQDAVTEDDILDDEALREYERRNAVDYVAPPICR